MPVMKLGDKLMCHSSIDFSFASHCPQSQSQPGPFLHASGWITVATVETEHCGMTRDPVWVFMRGATPDYRWHYTTVSGCAKIAQISRSVLDCSFNLPYTHNRKWNNFKAILNIISMNNVFMCPPLFFLRTEDIDIIHFLYLVCKLTEIWIRFQWCTEQ